VSVCFLSIQTENNQLSWTCLFTIHFYLDGHQWPSDKLKCAAFELGQSETVACQEPRVSEASAVPIVEILSVSAL